jgi:hypothetical protein
MSFILGLLLFLTLGVLDRRLPWRGAGSAEVSRW